MNRTNSLTENQRETVNLNTSAPGQEDGAPTGIVKILQCSNLGGMEQVTYSLLKELTQDRLMRFRITTPRAFGKGKGILLNFDPLCQDHQYRGKFGWRSFATFQRHIRELARDSNHIWITGTCASSLAAVRSLPQKKVLGHHFHHFDSATASLRWFGFYHALCRQLDAITYPTDFTRNEALQIAPWLRSKSHVVPYGYPICYTDENSRKRDQTEARRILDLPAEAFIVGNAGWLIARKRFDIFLQAASKIKESFPGAFFVICGGGPMETELKNLASKLGLAGSVRFAGWIKDLSLYYKAWDVCLFNSDLDALGRTPMEAASHGCLVAASVRYGGLSEYLTNQKNGIFLRSHDLNTLARETVTFAKDPNRATDMRHAATDKLRADYSPAKSLEFYRSFFSE